MSDEAGAPERQGAEARYLQAWFLFVGPDGEPSTDRAAARISIGATHAGRVRVIVPEGLDVAPAVAERIAERVAEAARIARNPDARFAPPAADDFDAIREFDQTTRADYPERHKTPGTKGSDHDATV